MQHVSSEKSSPEHQAIGAALHMEDITDAYTDTDGLTSLEIISAAPSGTVVTLTVPAQVAYGPRGWLARLVDRWTARPSQLSLVGKNRQT